MKYCFSKINRFITGEEDECSVIFSNAVQQMLSTFIIYI